jgi:DNA-binding transcriptional ArsR family regulator
MPTTQPHEAFMMEAAALLRAMSNKKRIIILDILSRGEMSVGALAIEVKLSQSALSQHLTKLKAANLVRTRRDAQTIFYSCDSEAVIRVLETLYDVFDKGRKRIAA